MKSVQRLWVLGSLAVSALFWTSAAQAGEHAAHAAPHWAYEGEHGTAHWGEMDPAFSACSTGKAQSPVDLVEGGGASSLPPVSFAYKPSALRIVNNGHTIQANYDAGSSIKIGDQEYALAQFHFHGPSEHTRKGRSFPLEVHFVHKNAKGELAVVGVLIQEGKENAALAALWKSFPAKEGEKAEPKNATVDAAALLPAGHDMDRYDGSLTTPPCSEGVKWHVMDEPIQMSAAQIQAFKKLFPMNARPVQPLNGRSLQADHAAAAK